MVVRMPNSLGYPVITTLSDFSEEGPYPAVMKGIILSICPEARVVDISHVIPRFDVHYAAHVLALSALFFPAGSIHLAVVDPGVGTGRRPILVQTRRFFFVGPDNGLLSIAAKRDGVVSIREIQNPKYMLEGPSRTFHGRDIFAPAAAYLAKGIPPEEIGLRLDSFQELEVGEPRFREGGLLGEVVYTDPFGNLVTNIAASMLMDCFPNATFFKVQVGDVIRELRLQSTYGESDVGEPLILTGSSGMIEIAVNRGSARNLFYASAGTCVSIRLVDNT